MILVVALVVLVAGAGCRWGPSRHAVAPPVALPPAPPGMAVSGFWTSWGRPLWDILAEYRAAHGGRQGRLAVTIEKGERRLVVSCDGVPVKGYFVALGSAPEGAKECRGDGRTPEGRYYLWRKNRQSHYYLALGVSYPGEADAERGLAKGLIDRGTYERIVRAIRAGKAPPQDTPLGGDICIHGGGMGEVVRQDGRRYVRVQDWTAGCIALRNRDMDELLAVLPVGTPIEIRA